MRTITTTSCSQCDNHVDSSSETGLFYPLSTLDRRPICASSLRAMKNVILTSQAALALLKQVCPFWHPLTKEMEFAAISSRAMPALGDAGAVQGGSAASEALGDAHQEPRQDSVCSLCWDSAKTCPQRKMKHVRPKEPGLHLATLFGVLPSSPSEQHRRWITGPMHHMRSE